MGVPTVKSPEDRKHPCRPTQPTMPLRGHNVAPLLLKKIKLFMIWIDSYEVLPSME
jgi:hypothetical protein